MTVLAATASDSGGITGVLLDLVQTLGPVGVGMTIFIETVIPPIPSEVVLSAAGVLINQGEMSFVPVVLFATLGSVLGAAFLYAIGRALGPVRSRAFLDRLPLVETSDVERTFAWFERHGRAAVFFGRMVPIVRSFVSVPAGVVRMPWPQFLVYTTAGSLIWNSVLIGLGVAVGDLVYDYLHYVNYLIYAAIVGGVAWMIYRRGVLPYLQRDRAGREDRTPGDTDARD
ncbi:DedA family protein [Modestobacter sp. I12A-02628]|uniref:DedA family protein n=1 Tax=Goekera deserti TaxID=2497753 RepID=A0A7K3W9W4_9ACTN|nr:DedA family protein [Goekera deserti]MPQ98934.1 DedA family protein [Goekera deserti]NDI49566.1 DedA family protein [Goekera deserti]NEL53241.1 DedA family protein [Goekera deserti]